MYDRKQTDICYHCGADIGIHKFETMNCPKNGMEEYREGKRQEWQENKFEDSGLKQFEISAVNEYDKLKQDNAILLNTMKEIAIDYPDGNDLTDRILCKYLIARAQEAIRKVTQ